MIIKCLRCFKCSTNTDIKPLVRVWTWDYLFCWLCDAQASQVCPLHGVVTLRHKTTDHRVAQNRQHKTCRTANSLREVSTHRQTIAWVLRRFDLLQLCKVHQTRQVSLRFKCCLAVADVFQHLNNHQQTRALQNEKCDHIPSNIGNTLLRQMLLGLRYRE